jgi:hypothetical protein
MSTLLTSADAGCLIDGHWGQYGVARMVTLAADLGYENHADIALAERKLAAMMPSDAPALSEDDEESLSNAADDVEQWLNENAAPSGYLFGWHDGEFFLQSVDWWNEDYAL